MTSSSLTVLVVNGPNLNLLGSRDPDVYGMTSLSELEDLIRGWAGKLDIQDVQFLQTNHEGEIIDALQSTDCDGIVINPGAFAHTSRAIADAIAAIGPPVVEVHISNIKQREPWRSSSVLEDVVARSIFGRGLIGYRDALRLLVNMQTPFQTVRYGPHPENVGDLRVPDGASKLIMLIHGGFWLQEWGRDTMDSLAVDLFRRGLATWNVEYRRSNAGGSWPGSTEDVWLAHHFVGRDQSVSGTDLGLTGHSAGGYLALLLSEQVEVFRTVALAPITDLDLLVADDGPGANAASSLLAKGAPRQVTGSAVLAVHGDRDEWVSPEQSRRLADAAVEILPGIGHFELLDPKRRFWSEVAATLTNGA